MNGLFLKLKIINEISKIVLKGKNFSDFILSKPVQIFEKKIAERAGSKYAFGVASGTDALILSLKALDIRPGDEVIVPAVGFYSSAGAVSWVNAKPVFVDVSLKDYNIDVSKIEQAINYKTKAIIAIHLNGSMADMDEISRIAEKRSLKVIVDASHAIGSSYKNKSFGSFGDLICMSLNFTKTFGTYGDGGVIFVNDDALAQKISQLRIYGAPKCAEIHWNNNIVGVASRLGVLEAAILNEKLPYLDLAISKQRENYFLYKEILSPYGGSPEGRENVGDLEFLLENPDYFINGYRLPFLTKRREEMSKFLLNRGVKLHNFYPIPLPYLPVFKNLGYNKGDFAVAEKIAEECLILPTNYLIKKEAVRQLAALVKEFFGNVR